MAMKKGLIVLMGSGELTSTMVEVHKDILNRLGRERRAVFLDTPAGFQLNADELSQRAVEYFRTRVQNSMSIVSFKSKDISPVEAEQAYNGLRESDYVLVGPGSPTYAVKQWIQTPIPGIITKRIRDGACFVAASAAALTVGQFTMPVYEIYKVGQEPEWVEGMNILGNFGIKAVVIPHWNNAEGGTHDTRCCFVGESRFSSLAALLPEDVGVLGLDEHTACIMDFESEEAEIRGIGSMTIQYRGSTKTFQRGERIPIDIIRGTAVGTVEETQDQREARPQPISEQVKSPFWDSVHKITDTFHKGLDADPADATNAILELDRTIWQAQQDLENVEFITQSREILRELIVLLGTRLASSPKSRDECITPIVDSLIALREDFRKDKKWKEADAIRDCLLRADIVVEDTADGSRWSLKHDEKRIEDPV